LLPGWPENDVADHLVQLRRTVLLCDQQYGLFARRPPRACLGVGRVQHHDVLMHVAVIDGLGPEPLD